MKCSFEYNGQQHEVLKCPEEEAYYQTADLVDGENNIQVYSRRCQNDTQHYQVCGAVTEKSRRKYDELFLCGYFVCQDPPASAGSDGKYVSGGVLDSFIKCNDKIECSNGADELNCENMTPDTSFTCNYSGTKILKSKVCDGITDCPAGDDENGSCDHKTGLFCEDWDGNITWISPFHICPPGQDWGYCKHFEDVSNCDVHEGGRWCQTIRNQIRYIKKSQMCFHAQAANAFDYKVCEDGRDQLNCTNVALTCNVGGFPTTISRYGLCQGYHQCQDSFDDFCTTAETDCYVHKHQLCDGTADCEYKGDEKAHICEDVTSDFKCIRRVSASTQNKLNLPKTWLCDGVKDCLDGSDEDFTEWNVCGSNDTIIRCVEKNEICTEMFKCPGVDKKFSRIQNLCDNVEECHGENQICQESRGIKEVLSFALSFNATTKMLSYQCLPGIKDHGNCDHEHLHNSPDQNIYGVTPTVIKYASLSIGVSCKFFFGELYVYHSCNDLCSDASCPLLSIPHHSCSNTKENAKTFAVHSETGKQYLTVVHKDNEGYKNNLFSCKNGRCVTYDRVCNLADDCGDGSDEESCINNYQCNKSAEYIPLSAVCDGHVDCIDLSDECNDQCHIQILDHIALKVCAWTFGLLATITNFVVVIRKIATFSNITTKTTLANTIFVVFIGLGDLMVGLYLIGVSIADTIFSKSYCTERFVWLNNGYCTTLGILSTAGSTLSLFSMTCLSLFRFHTIRNIFSSRQISRKTKLLVLTTIAVIITLVAIIVFIPILPIFEDYFLNGIHYGKHVPLFIGAPTKHDHINILERYYGRLKDSMVTWQMIRNLVMEMFTKDHGGICGSDQKFYGNSGVCLFKYFVGKSDPQRLFSLTILSLNFFLCLLITFSYLGVYFSSRYSMRSAGDNKSSNLERKISLIIVSDFIAWVPFIVLCYLHFFGIFDGRPLYGVFSIVILPVNSVINPLIYDETYGVLGRWIVRKKNNFKIGQYVSSALGISRITPQSRTQAFKLSKIERTEIKEAMSPNLPEEEICSPAASTQQLTEI